MRIQSRTMKQFFFVKMETREHIFEEKILYQSEECGPKVQGKDRRKYILRSLSELSILTFSLEYNWMDLKETTHYTHYSYQYHRSTNLLTLLQKFISEVKNVQ